MPIVPPLVIFKGDYDSGSELLLHLHELHWERT